MKRIILSVFACISYFRFSLRKQQPLKVQSKIILKFFTKNHPFPMLFKIKKRSLVSIKMNRGADYKEHVIRFVEAGLQGECGDG